MAGGLLALGGCYGCGKVMEFHPERVPSVVVCLECRRPTDLHAAECSRAERRDGVRMPLCADCVRRKNEHLREQGLPPVEVLPGAYDGQIVE